MNSIFRILLKLGSGGLAVGILWAAGWYSLHLIKTPVKAPKSPARPSVPIIGVAELKPGNHPVSVEAFGTVVTARELILRPEVRGRVVEIHPNLQVGGTIKSGEQLVRIDPSDFEIALRRANAAFAEVDAEWKIEQGRQAVAKREWELLNGNNSSRSSALALREPQLQKIEAMRIKAQADLDAAKLALARTAITAPFESVVLTESAEVGQLLDTNTQIARLVGTEEFWIEALVPLRDIETITFPSNGNGGANVQIRMDTGNGPILRSGTIIRQLADLDPEGRMARILVSITDPLNLKNDPNLRSIPLGSFVRLSIDAGEIRNLVSIPRAALRENDQIWIRDNEGKLRICDVEIVWRRDQDILVSNRFSTEDRVITTHLSGVIPGIKVRVKGEDSLPAHASKEKDRKKGPGV